MGQPGWAVTRVGVSGGSRPRGSPGDAPWAPCIPFTRPPQTDSGGREPPETPIQVTPRPAWPNSPLRGVLGTREVGATFQFSVSWANNILTDSDYVRCHFFGSEAVQVGKATSVTAYCCSRNAPLPCSPAPPDRTTMLPSIMISGGAVAVGWDMLLLLSPLWTKP